MGVGQVKYAAVDGVCVSITFTDRAKGPLQMEGV